MRPKRTCLMRYGSKIFFIRPRVILSRRWFVPLGGQTDGQMEGVNALDRRDRDFVEKT